MAEKKQMHPVFKWGLVSVTILALASGVMREFHQDKQNVKLLQLAAGAPLVQRSNAQIQVLDDQPQMVTTSEQALQADTVVDVTTLVDAKGGADVAKPATIPAEVLAAQIAQATLHMAKQQQGTQVVRAPSFDSLVMLLVQSYAQGGVAPRQIANKLVSSQQINDVSPALQQALTALRDGTPRQGPTTLLAVLADVRYAQGLEALVVQEAAAEEQPVEESQSWWRAQLAKFVKVRTAESSAPQEDWGQKLREAEQLLARNLIADARQVLTNGVLARDPRLNFVRDSVTAYAQSLSLVQAVQAAYVAEVLSEK